MKYLVRATDIDLLEIDHGSLIESVEVNRSGRSIHRKEWGEVWIYEGSDGDDLFMALKYGRSPAPLYDDEYKQLETGPIFLTRERFQEITSKIRFVRFPAFTF